MQRLLLITLLVLFLSACNSEQNQASNLNNSVDQNQNTNPSTDILEQIPERFQDITIPGLRAKPHPGSQISIVQELSPGTNYRQAIASYHSDGLNINGLLTIPDTPPPPEGFPAIVFVHGYIPPNQYQTTQRYQAYVDGLASQGFVVYKIDLRGHGQSEGEAEGAYFSGAYVSDILNAVSSLRQYPNINPESIGLWGHSMAGNLVMRALAVDSKIRAGVIWAGAVYTYQDFSEFGISDSSYRRDSDSAQRSRSRSQDLFETVGERGSETPFWQAIAPTNYLDQTQAGVQLHHASNDLVVPVEYSRNLSSLLEEAGLDHQLHIYSSGGHDIEGSSFNQAMTRTVDFYRQRL